MLSGEDFTSERHRFCPACGTKAAATGALFCGDCGYSLAKVIRPAEEVDPASKDPMSTGVGLPAPRPDTLPNSQSSLTEVSWDLADWDEQHRSELAAALIREGIPHHWEGLELSTDREYEERVDDIVDILRGLPESESPPSGLDRLRHDEPIQPLQLVRPPSDSDPRAAVLSPPAFWGLLTVGLAIVSGVEIVRAAQHGNILTIGGVWILCLIGVPICYYRWWKSLNPTIRHRVAQTTFRTWTCAAVVSGAVLLYGIFTNHGTDDRTANRIIFIGGWATAICVLLIILFGYILLLRYYGRAINTAMQPIPTPAEISVMLQQEWGRTATVEEVYAVHRMLTDKRNEAAFFAGAITLGALYLNRQAHGR